MSALMVARGKAFTLIELLAVLLLAALLAGVTAISLRGSRPSMSLGSALSELELCDELIRERARRSDWPVEMVFDLRNNQILRVETLPKNKKEVRRVLMKLPQGVRIDRIKVADRSLGGEVRLACSSKGYMPSYAFALQAGTQRQWVLVPGIPGKFRKMQHESEVDDIFRTLAISGSDAR